MFVYKLYSTSISIWLAVLGWHFPAQSLFLLLGS